MSANLDDLRRQFMHFMNKEDLNADDVSIGIGLLKEIRKAGESIHELTERDELSAMARTIAERLVVLTGQYYPVRLHPPEWRGEDVADEDAVVFWDNHDVVAAHRLSFVSDIDFQESLRTYLHIIINKTAAVSLTYLDSSEQMLSELALSSLYVDQTVERQFELAGISHMSPIASSYYNEKVILLGDPGSGKTTYLHHIANLFARAALEPDEKWLQNLTWREHIILESESEEGKVEPEEQRVVQRYWDRAALIPVVVRLRDFAHLDMPNSPLSLWKHIKSQLQKDGLANTIPAIEQKAKHNQLIFMLDGIDEVPAEQRRAIWSSIQALGQGPLAGNRWIVTCRTLSFDQAEAPPNSKIVQLEAFGEAQIAHFVDNWFRLLVHAGNLSPQRVEQNGHGLISAIRNIPQLRELAQNPMLLTIMVVVQTYFGRLPTERAKLYQAMTEALLIRREKMKGSRDSDISKQLDVTTDVLQRMLCEIAWQAQGQTDSSELTEHSILHLMHQYLGSYAKAEQFLYYTDQRAHLLVSRGGAGERTYAFQHRVFQEYLAACHLASQRRFGRRATELASEGAQWREVLNLAAGELVFNRHNQEKVLDAIEDMLPHQLPEAEDTVAWRRVWFAAEMLSTVGHDVAARDEVGRELLPRIRLQLTHLLEDSQLTVVQRAAAANVLARLGDPRQGIGWIESDGVRVPDIAWGILVPAGLYSVGGDVAAKAPELHKIEISASFRLARYPITYAQFQCFEEAPDFADPRWWEGMPDEENENEVLYRLRELGNQRFQIQNRPRENVSWYQAVAFCRWLTDKLGYTVDLPNEYEWEVSARYPDDRYYPWGDDFDPAKANTGDSSAPLGETSAVGLFPEGANRSLDLYDLSGNVWEWCRAPYNAHEGDALAVSSRHLALRGGAWSTSVRDACRAAFRIGAPYPNFRSDDLGFRICMRHSSVHSDY